MNVWFAVRSNERAENHRHGAGSAARRLRRRYRPVLINAAAGDLFGRMGWHLRFASAMMARTSNLEHSSFPDRPLLADSAHGRAACGWLAVRAQAAGTTGMEGRVHGSDHV
jgi:hypothetical protein